MSLLDVFCHRQKKERENSAAIARERLQILVTHHRSDMKAPDYLPEMKKDILAVIGKYVTVEQENVSIHFESADDISVLEVEVTLPEEDQTKVRMA
ncbi:cell division topological specificity factor MinE [Sansalvadorimonas sp. 2012CJ34-2]|uniref:Cell division topological specificity factor n=1 Tax=Parendozoicomonas callyspongiae TaxID=2942213 RepID=A0ABT0PE28_9GAMM|nr:cell division topological specificity factor MinE [Sansalvadorimonas sp. 2012CJ34-2]MCL6269610.1 cell division topological specificity factor MinE [Sansalvadorimonas sp. 2012CJ34-2]